MRYRIFFTGLLSVFYSLAAFAQDQTGHVYFIRPFNYTGAAVPVHMFIDGKLVCKLKNKHFSVHELAAGAHTIAVQNTGLSRHTISAPDTIQVEAGKDVYVKLRIADNKISMQTLTEFSADYDLKRVNAMSECLKE